jgi:hypothetical protein
MRSTRRLHYSGDADDKAAYAFGTVKFKAGELEGIFDEYPEMTDAIQKAIKNNAGIEGYLWAKMLAD